MPAKKKSTYRPKTKGKAPAKKKSTKPSKAAMAKFYEAAKLINARKNDGAPGHRR